MRGDGGEVDVLSASLHSPVLSWWGESPTVGGGVAVGRGRARAREWEDGDAEA